MAVAFKTALGTGVSTSSGTTLTITTTAAIAIGDLVVVRVAADNLNATTPTFTCADGGNTYTSLAFRGQNATAAAGVVGGILATKATVARSSGSTITITLSGAVTNKSAYAESFTGAENTVRSAAVVASGASAAASSGASGTVNAGDLVLGAAGVETRANSTGDTDTTNGSWSTITQIASGTTSTDTSRVMAAGQYKIATATGAQTYNITNTNTDWVAMVVVLQATPDPAVTQAAYQWFGEGTEAGATSLAAQNTAVTGDITNGDATGTLRIRLQATTAVAVPTTDDWQLQFEKNASGSWVNVGAATDVRVYDSPNLTNAQATTNRLTGGTGSFVAGKVSEDSLMDDLGWSASNYTEIVYALKVLAAPYVQGDTIRFRVLRNGVTTTMTYSVTPTINIIRSAVDYPGTITSDWGGWTATANGTVTTPVVDHPASITTNWSGGAVEYGDNFDRADTAAPGLGAGWEAPDWRILGNAAAKVAGGSDYARFLTDVVVTDQWVEMVIPGHGNGDFRVINCRMTAALGQSGVLGFADYQSGFWKIGKTQGGSYSDVVVGNAATIGGTYTLRLECEGTTARLYFNDGLVASGSIAGLTLGTFVGMNANVNNATMDSLRCGPLPYGVGGAGWTATATGTVNHLATVATAWGNWTATATATVGHPATITTVWGNWTATATAQREAYAGITTSWGQWTASALATVGHPGTIASDWGNWTAIATGLATPPIIDYPGTIVSNWGGWTATAVGTVGVPAIVVTHWGNWTATAIAAVSHTATVITNWGNWIGIGLAVVAKPATITTAWGTWTAVGVATVGKTATVTSAWGNWTAIAVGSLQHTATITSHWGNWTGIAIGATEGQVAGVIASNWGGWNATALGSVTHHAVVTADWGGWTATAVGKVEHQAVSAAAWGGWTAVAVGTVEHSATTSVTWGDWTATAIGARSGYAAITTTWGGWEASAIGIVVTPGAIEGQWEGQAFDAMMYGSDEVVEWMMV